MKTIDDTGSAPVAGAPAPAPPRATRPSRLGSRRPTGDVGLALAAALALPLYGACIYVAKRLPAYYREILLERGWVMHAIMIPTCVALVILAMKAVGLHLQRRAFEGELLPAEPARIGPDDVATVLEHVEARRQERAAKRLAPSFLLERARRALEHYAARRDVEETAAFHGAEADADANALASSLGMVKVLIWAIPILGFIGTVIGIGDAVVGFSRSLDGASQLEAIKGSLGDVTTGLAVAFDTTLVSLIASILVMVPMNLVQKADEQLLSDVDDRCVTDVLRRLVTTASAPAPVVVATGETAITPVRESPSLQASLAEPLREMLAAHTRLLEKMSADREILVGAQASLADHLATFAAASRSLGPSVERAVSQLEQATALAERSTGALRRNEEQLGRELGASRQLLQILAAGMGREAGSEERPPPTNGHAVHGSNGRHAAALVTTQAEE